MISKDALDCLTTDPPGELPVFYVAEMAAELLLARECADELEAQHKFLVANDDDLIVGGYALEQLREFQKR